MMSRRLLTQAVIEIYNQKSAHAGNNLELKATVGDRLIRELKLVVLC